MSSFANVSPGRIVATRVSLQDSVPSHGLGGSFELRPPMPRGIELRLGADVRRTDGESRELFTYVAGQPTRRRRAGGKSWTSGAFAEATASLRGITLTAGARLDHWRVSDGHLFEQTIATGAMLRDEHFRSRDGWLPTARGGLAGAARRRLQPALGGLSRLAHADAQRAVPAVSRRARRDRGQSRASIPSGWPAPRPAWNMRRAACACR